MIGWLRDARFGWWLLAGMGFGMLTVVWDVGHLTPGAFVIRTMVLAAFWGSAMAIATSAMTRRRRTALRLGPSGPEGRAAAVIVVERPPSAVLDDLRRAFAQLTGAGEPKVDPRRLRASVTTRPSWWSFGSTVEASVASAPGGSSVAIAARSRVTWTIVDYGTCEHLVRDVARRLGVGSEVEVLARLPTKSM